MDQSQRDIFIGVVKAIPLTQTKPTIPPRLSDRLFLPGKAVMEFGVGKIIEHKQGIAIVTT